MLETVKLFPAWQQSLQSTPDLLERGIPWLNVAATRFLEQTLHADMYVYEYGSGGSTIFFSRRVKKVISLEHDVVWANEVESFLKKNNLQNVQLRLISSDEHISFCPDKVADPDANMSQFVSASFSDYVTSIDDYPDEYFDIILIDGRARPSCLKRSIPKVKIGGYIILDDADRERYQPAMQTMPDNFDKLDFVSPILHEYCFGRTVVWYRRW
jgi:hypothetical protein